ncbi:MAG: hypothetical protein DRQ48_11565, partial [Gammaproteobacteria bacterium]
MSKIIRLVLLVFCLHGLTNQVSFASAVDISFKLSFGQEDPSPPGDFNYPSGIAVDKATGDVFVADQLFGRVQRFDADGNYITQWASNGLLGLDVDSTDHSVYVAVLHGSKIRKYDANGQLLFEFGPYVSEAVWLSKPLDVAVNPVTRNIYVSSSGNRQILELTSAGVFVRQWSSPDFSTTIYGVATDPSGQFIYLADSGYGRIYKYDTNGNRVTQWGAVGSAPDLRWPRGISVDASGNVYVASTDNNEIVKFDADGNFIKNFHGPNNDIDGSFHPRAIDVNTATGDIYATSSYDHRIDRFLPDDTFNYSWGGLDTTGTNFNRPKGVAIDPNTNDIYVADTWNQKIKKFSDQGVFLSEYGTTLSVTNHEDTINFPSQIAIDSSSNLWLLNGGVHYPGDPENWSDKYVREFDKSGNFLSAFGYPGFNGQINGLLLNDAANEIYVADTNNNKIVVFDFGGNFKREFGSPGAGPGNFIRPGSMALDNNILYVVDSGNNRIQKLDTNGNNIDQFSASFGFTSQSSIDIDDFGHIYVADTNNHRIQVFDLNGNYITELGAGRGGHGNGIFLLPTGLTVRGNTLVIADTNDFQVEVYNITPLPDADNDDIADVVDNCPITGNFNQADQDNDQIGDVCDNCSVNSNTDQEDTDGDDVGNICDSDDDNDGLIDSLELTFGTDPLLADSDSDSLSDYDEVAWDGDASTYTLGVDLNPLSEDTDGDGLSDAVDPNPLVFNNTEIVWIDDAVPAGATQVGTWNFISTNPTPFSGALAHQSILGPGLHQHYFYGTSDTL